MRYVLEEFLRKPQWKLVDDQKFESFRKRKANGGNAFDKKPQDGSDSQESQDES